MSRVSRPRPALFRALGRAEPPITITIGRQAYTRVHVYKHDSWAATARYSGPGGEVVCKFNRVHRVLGVPMGWLGRRLAKREAAFLRQLAGVPGVPPACGAVSVDGRVWQHAVAHAYVPGEPLSAQHRLDERFFPALRGLLAAMHYRGIAYVDLHKRENILVSENGEPYLIDFQVSFGVWSKRWARTALGKTVLRALQQADRYHLAKHVAAHRPDQAGQIERPWWISAHRVVGVPLRQLRRRLLTALGIRQRGGRADTESFPEEAVRQQRRAA